jgi:hypothetical protein
VRHRRARGHARRQGAGVPQGPRWSGSRGCGVRGWARQIVLRERSCIRCADESQALMFFDARESGGSASHIRRHAPARSSLCGRGTLRGVKLSEVSCCTANGQRLECHNGRARTGVRWRGGMCHVATVEGLGGLIVRLSPCTAGYQRGGGCYCRRRTFVARVVERHLTESIWRSFDLEDPPTQTRTTRGSRPRWTHASRSL